jgi:hypothetical protein
MSPTPVCEPGLQKSSFILLRRDSNRESVRLGGQIIRSVKRWIKTMAILPPGTACPAIRGDGRKMRGEEREMGGREGKEEGQGREGEGRDGKIEGEDA